MQGGYTACLFETSGRYQCRLYLPRLFFSREDDVLVPLLSQPNRQFNSTRKIRFIMGVPPHIREQRAKPGTKQCARATNVPQN